jgi:short-subunit dehydrogenase involved in D-alanine esterification of teichoic acids
MPLQTAQTVLVTGASEGIGRELALQLAAQGHTVIAWARNEARLDSLRSAHIETKVIDLANTMALPAAVAELLIAHPHISGVIHNAAIQIERDLIDSDAALTAQEIAINLTAPIVITQSLLPHLCKQPAPFICNISSALALAAKRKSAVYCATKAGLHLFSDSLRAQLRGTTVQVTEIMPPTVETRMTAHRNVPKMAATAVAAQTIQSIRQGRSSVLLGNGKLLGVLLYLLPPLAKKIMLKF